jgi:hypothetical protein
MFLAALFHIVRGEYSFLPINLVLGGVAAFIAYGRFAVRPIAPTSTSGFGRLVQTDTTDTLMALPVPRFADSRADFSGAAYLKSRLRLCLCSPRTTDQARAVRQNAEDAPC